MNGDEKNIKETMVKMTSLEEANAFIIEREKLKREKGYGEQLKKGFRQHSRPKRQRLNKLAKKGTETRTSQQKQEQSNRRLLKLPNRLRPNNRSRPKPKPNKQWNRQKKWKTKNLLNSQQQQLKSAKSGTMRNIMFYINPNGIVRKSNLKVKKYLFLCLMLLMLKIKNVQGFFRTIGIPFFEIFLE